MSTSRTPTRSPFYVYLSIAFLAIAIVGIAARYWHLKQEKPEPYQPEGVALTEEARNE